MTVVNCVLRLTRRRKTKTDVLSPHTIFEYSYPLKMFRFKIDEETFLDRVVHFVLKLIVPFSRLPIYLPLLVSRMGFGFRLSLFPGILSSFMLSMYDSSVFQVIYSILSFAFLRSSLWSFYPFWEKFIYYYYYCCCCFSIMLMFIF